MSLSLCGPWGVVGTAQGSAWAFGWGFRAFVGRDREEAAEIDQGHLRLDRALVEVERRHVDVLTE